MEPLPGGRGLILFGGNCAREEHARDVYLLDLEMYTWERPAAVKAPEAVLGVAACVAGRTRLLLHG